MTEKFAFENAEVYVLPFGPLETNCYVLKSGGEIAVIDPSAQTAPEKEELISFLQSLNGNVKFIINTHGHFDHIAANKVLKDSFKESKIAVHEKDGEMLLSSKLNGSVNFGLNIVSDEPDILLKDEDTLKVGDAKLKVLHIPGHTKGSIALYNEKGGFVFTGDTLFAGTVGIAKNFKNAFSEMIKGIKEKLLVLPDETVIFPGHNEESTIGEEKRHNPFLQD